jgi:hypothetical protein
LSIASRPHPDLTISTVENGGKTLPEHPKIEPNRGDSATKMPENCLFMSHNSPQYPTVQPGYSGAKLDKSLRMLYTKYIVTVVLSVYIQWAGSSRWLEQRTHNPLVVCSTHTRPTIVYSQCINRRMHDIYYIV